MENLNAFDFQAAAALFAEERGLPPFPGSDRGSGEHSRVYVRRMLEQGISEPAAAGFTQIKVTSKVQTPWFGNRVGINLAWRFLLNPEDRIFFVGIDVLASSQELLNLGLVR
jgi:hypothetical protein